MKQFFVIAADSDYYNVFVREVTMEHASGGEFIYKHAPDAPVVACGTPDSTLPKELREILVVRKLATCDATVVQNCEDRNGQLCGKKCAPGHSLCAEHLAEVGE